LAAKWIEAEKDIESKQTFYNTQLALPFKTEATKEISSKTVASRREAWTGVPEGVCVITVGVDVQSGGSDSIGRLEVETVGWSPDEESWSLDYNVFLGDPAKLEVWAELDAYLLRHWERQDGRRLRVMGTCIDSGGHNTEEVYKFCLARAARNVWAIKGASDRSGQWVPVWPARDFRRTRRRKTPSLRYRPVIIGVNAAKEAIRQRLLIKEPGPGYCHFPAGRPAGYFDQLTAERLIVERKGGMMIRRWHLQSHLSNEALDTRVYAYAALQGLINDRGFKPAHVARILLSATAAEEAGATGPVSGSGQLNPSSTVVEAPPPSLVLKAPPAPASAVRPPVKVPAVVARRAMTTRSSFMSRRGRFY
jgi:phage terminase large subunit GpA-like protein